MNDFYTWFKDNPVDAWSSVGLTAAGLGLTGYSLYKGWKQSKQSKEDFDNLIKQLPASMASATAKDVDTISTKLGLTIPVAVIEDAKLAKQYGVDDNAYFMPPGWAAKALAKQLKKNILKHHDKAGESGLVVMSDKFSPVPILAHELGHARDYKDGNLQPWKQSLAGLAGVAGGLAIWNSVGDRLYDAVRKSSGSPTLGYLSAAAAAAIPSALAMIYNQRASKRAERAATAHAKNILSKYRNRKAVAIAGRLLDRAYQTYEDAYDNERMSKAGGVLLGGGVIGGMNGWGEHAYRAAQAAAEAARNGIS